jgi:hypothetical protein
LIENDVPRKPESKKPSGSVGLTKEKKSKIEKDCVRIPYLADFLDRDAKSLGWDGTNLTSIQNRSFITLHIASS